MLHVLTQYTQYLAGYYNSSILKYYTSIINDHKNTQRKTWAPYINQDLKQNNKIKVLLSERNKTEII